MSTSPANVGLATAGSGAAREWLAVVRAVTRRQFVTLLRYQASFWASLASPFLSLAVAMFLAKAFAGAAGPEGFAASSGTADFRSYLTLSVLFWAFVESQLSFGFGLLGEMERGTLESLFLTPMPRSAYLVGMALYSFARTGLSVGLTLAAGLLVFGIEPPFNPAWAVGLTVLNLVVVHGYGLVLAAVVLLVRSGAFTYAWGSVLPLLAGQTFSVGLLPAPLRAISAALPLTYGLDALRWAFSGARPAFPLGLEVAVLALSAVALPAIGLALFGRVERIARQRGSFGQF